MAMVKFIAACEKDIDAEEAKKALESLVGICWNFETTPSIAGTLITGEMPQSAYETTFRVKLKPAGTVYTQNKPCKIPKELRGVFKQIQLDDTYKFHFD